MCLFVINDNVEKKTAELVLVGESCLTSGRELLHLWDRVPYWLGGSYNVMSDGTAAPSISPDADPKVLSCMRDVR